ncbi:MAG TPA: hypothetical protein VEK08_08875 [Planctomycetota bacterium]|nr:hypothetical protein [Planctomycetota bacterium]
MSNKALSTVLVVVLFTAVGICAAADDAKTGNQSAAGASRFDHRIDTWVEGTILSLDADGKKFSVRGSKMPVATQHAAMMKDMHSKTANLDAAKRQEKEAEVRKAWADRLASARTEKRDDPSDFNFALPGDGKLSVLSSSSVQDVDWLRGDVAAGGDAADAKAERPIATGANTDRDEARAMMTLKDLKIGDKVMVGYDSGIITNEAYVVVKHGDMAKAGAAHGADAKAAGQKQPAAQQQPAGAR